MADETTKLLLTESQVAERLGFFIKHYGRPDPIARDIAWRREGQLSVAEQFIKWEEVDTTVGTVPAKVEAADAARVTLDQSQQTATPVLHMFEIAPTDEALKGANPDLGVPQSMVEHAIGSFRRRRDVATMAASTSATSIAGAVTDLLTEEKFFAGIGVFEALEPLIGPEGSIAVVGHNGGNVLRKSALLSSAGSRVGDRFGKMPAGSNFMGELGGMPVLKSGNVATESTGHSNFITPIGVGYSGLGLAEAEDITVEVNRGSEGARAAVRYFVFRAAYAAVLTDVLGLTELRST